MPLINEITDDMVTAALTFPGRGIDWIPENGQIVYQKFSGVFMLTKNTDADCLETDNYCVSTTSYNIITLKENCVLVPSPDLIRDLGVDAGYIFSGLYNRGPDVWIANYTAAESEGTTPWEAEFNVFNKYIIGNCVP